MSVDRRYGSRHWKRLRLQVLGRDLWACWKCGGPANVADHIIRPEDGGPFWDPGNLRASCRRDNLLRHHPSKVVAGQPSPAQPPRNPLVVPMRKPQVW